MRVRATVAAMNTAYFAARFHSSASDPSQCPHAEVEVAFAGRSNAGKSSAINTLTRNGKLARTSRTPGRTQLINHFEVGGVPGSERFLVDLPGYGYAKVSRDKQNAWQRSMSEYLFTREALAGLIVVMDIRHPLQPVDWQLIDIQQQGRGELHVLLTKADKLSRSEQARQLETTRRSLEDEGVEATLQSFSALKRSGVEDVHAVLDQWLFKVPLTR